jgi:surface protein
MSGGGALMKTITNLALALLLVLALALAAACSNPVNGDDGSDDGGDTTPPGEVTGLYTTPGDGQMALNWTDPTDTDFASVEITWEPGGSDPQAVPAGTQTYTATGLTNGTDYTFTVRTVDESGNRSAGSTVSGTPQATATDTVPPAEVTGLSATRGAEEITLTWVDPFDSDFATVEITWEPGGSDPQSVSAGTQTYTATGLSAATEYAFTVKTVDEAGNTSTGESVTAETYIEVVDFTTVWQTDAAGDQTSSEPTQIILPLDSDGAYDFTVDWGDGSQDTITAWDQTEKTHTYSQAGTYTVTINGVIEGFGFRDIQSGLDQDNDKLIRVEAWGGVRLHSKGSQFADCSNLTEFTATDAPDLSTVTDMTEMFIDADAFAGGVSTWELSSVTTTRAMFMRAAAFNEDISGWDVSGVTDMNGMFARAGSFNADISGWDVSSVTDMGRMFLDATAFNQDLSGWCVSEIPTEPDLFADGSALEAAHMPNWGATCQ